MLRTKCILDEVEKEDGVRISVMSRHTLNDGLTAHPDISETSYHQHIIDLAPTSKLIGAYYKRNLSWEEFTEEYRGFLKTDNSQRILKKLIKVAKQENITLLCIEKEADKCHRRLIIEECLNIDATLKTQIS